MRAMDSIFVDHFKDNVSEWLHLHAENRVRSVRKIHYGCRQWQYDGECECEWNEIMLTYEGHYDDVALIFVRVCHNWTIAEVRAVQIVVVVAVGEVVA